MDSDSQKAVESPPPSAHPRWKHRLALSLAIVAGLYLLTAYALVPLVWNAYESRRPTFEGSPTITRTGDKHPGDPLNVALVGTKAEIENAMTLAGWYSADPLGLKSDVKIAADTILEKPYDTAPVSRLYLFGRPEDVAFEQPVGNDPKKRHHVRFWQTEKTHADGRAVWIGSASFDERVGLSHTTGQITHHIASDVDRERDQLAANLESTGTLAESYQVPGFHTVREGKNGGGDPWRTDGDLWVGIVKSR